MQRTLKREFKELEVVEREAIAVNCETTSHEIVPNLPRRMQQDRAEWFPLLQKHRANPWAGRKQVMEGSLRLRRRAMSEGVCRSPSRAGSGEQSGDESAGIDPRPGQER